MGCICQAKICTISCYTSPPLTYDCGTEDIRCSPNPCCNYACEYSVSGGLNYNQTTSTINCPVRYGVVGGTKVITTLTEVYTCEPISPPPPGCPTTSSSPPPPPPPGNDCGGAGG